VELVRNADILAIEGRNAQEDAVVQGAT